MKVPTKMYSLITKLTTVALMSLFVPVVTLSPIFLPGKAVAAVPANNSPTMLVQGNSNKGNFVGSLYASYQPTYHFAAEFAEMGG